jgi:uracil-DNA glycosylase family 4
MSTKLINLEEEIRNCKKCNFNEKKDARYCGGKGNDYRVMFIAESPSTKGGKGIFPAEAGFDVKYAADKLFFDARKKFGLENCYLTDYIKCGVPSGKPTVNKVNNCVHYLCEEIKDVNPKVIVTVGKYFYYIDGIKRKSPIFSDFIVYEFKKISHNIDIPVLSVDHYSHVYRYHKNNKHELKLWEEQFLEITKYL